MTHPVIISEPAEQELEAAAEWWAKNRSPEQALRWHEGFLAAIKSLAENPERCPLSRENERFECELRELYFGLGSRPTHRAVFTIRPDMVLVLTIRHVAQEDLEPEDER